MAVAMPRHNKRDHRVTALRAGPVMTIEVVARDGEAV
jgi:hypothetical protein